MAAVKTRNTATLMTEGSIVKSLLLFALPLIFGNLLQQMYNTADSIIAVSYTHLGTPQSTFAAENGNKKGRGKARGLSLVPFII